MRTFLSQAKAAPAALEPPPGYRGPRGEVLLELKRAQPLTAAELAGRLGTSLNAVRHHLKELEAEQLIEYRRQRRGVGAPAFAYRLSAGGEALFPRRYEAALLQVLDHLVERDGRAAAVAILEAQFTGLAQRLQPALDGASPAERAAVVTRALVEEGYMAEWQGSATGGRLTEHNCAIRALAERFPEVCAAEAKLLEATLGAAVQRRAHILGGCTTCEYSVDFPTLGAGAAERAAVESERDRSGPGGE